MRRFVIPLIAAVLAAIPLSSAAGDDPRPAPQAEPPRLGVMVTPLTHELRAFFGAPSDRGVLVARVMPGLPAARAGVEVGDVITEVAGAPVDDAHDVVRALGARTGDQVIVQVVRDRQARTLTATIGDRHVLDLFRWFPWHAGHQASSRLTPGPWPSSRARPPSLDTTLMTSPLP